MGFLTTLFSGFLRSGSQAAAGAVGIPGLAAVAELLAAIFIACDSVPQNKSAARQLAHRCQHLFNALERYEKTPIPDRTINYREDVFKCLQEVKVVMQKWSEKSWIHLLLHQGDFEVAIDECGNRITDCLATFTAAAQMEVLAHQKEDEKWKRDLKESLDADHQALLKEFSAVNFVQRATESKVTESQNDLRSLSIMMQKCLGERKTISKEEHDRMASNLYDLLRLSKQLPPVLQLDSGEVEWSDKIPVAGSRNVDIYKGRYLQREDVMIKVIRTINPKDERNVERIRREVDIWAKIYDMDQGKHIIPFYGFCTTDGLRLALVSPWIDNGDALTYVKRHDNLINYKKLIIGIAEGIQVLHSMDPPIIHGDLKAEKVLIGEEGQPLITDFALAKLEGNLVTQTAGVADGYRWSAPEMCIEPGTVSTKSDIYSFGMTILELFTHDKPYANLKRGAQVIKKIDNKERPDRPQDERAIERGLDDNMWELLCQCWIQESEDRPSIDKLVAQLRNPGVHTVVNIS